MVEHGGQHWSEGQGVAAGEAAEEDGCKAVIQV